MIIMVVLFSLSCKQEKIWTGYGVCFVSILAVMNRSFRNHCKGFAALTSAALKNFNALCQRTFSSRRCPTLRSSDLFEKFTSM